MQSSLQVLEPAQLPHKFSALRDLARSIRDKQAEIDSQKEDLTQRANSIGRNLRLLGLDLIKAKEIVKHGEWYDWLSSHSPNTSTRFAQFCMKIANANCSSDFDQCDSWSECRALLQGESPKTPAAKPWPESPNMRALKLFERWINALKEDAPIDAAPKSILDRYRMELEPVLHLLGMAAR